MAFVEGLAPALVEAEEVRIETTRPDGSTWRTIIWVVVEGGEIFIRSVRGERGHWYQAAVDRPEAVRLVLGDRAWPVRVTVATDEGSISRCSKALAEKYRDDPSLASMLRPTVLGATLRIEPR